MSIFFNRFQNEAATMVSESSILRRGRRLILEDDAGGRIDHGQVKGKELEQDVATFSDSRNFSQARKLQETDCLSHARRNAPVENMKLGNLDLQYEVRRQQSEARYQEQIQQLRNIVFQKKIGGVAAMADAESNRVEEEDPIVQLRNLKHVSHIRSYIEAFDELNSRAGIEEDQALSLFLSGLVDEIQKPVRMFKPKTLADAYALSKLQEFTMTGVFWCDREEGSNLRRNEKLDKELNVGGVSNGIDGSMELSNLCSERVIAIKETKPSSYSLGIDNKAITEFSESSYLTWSLSESSNLENLEHNQYKIRSGADVKLNKDSNDGLPTLHEGDGQGSESQEYRKLNTDSMIYPYDYSVRKLKDLSNLEKLKSDQYETDLGVNLDNFNSMIENERKWKGLGDNSRGVNVREQLEKQFGGGMLLVSKVFEFADEFGKGIEGFGWLLASTTTSSSDYRSLKQLLVWVPKPLVKMKFMPQHGEVIGEDLNSMIFPISNKFEEAKFLPTLQQNALVRELVVTLIVMRGVRLSVWGPKPMVKMKLGKDEAREAWLRDSLRTRNLKGDELLRSQLKKEKRRMLNKRRQLINC